MARVVFRPNRPIFEIQATFEDDATRKRKELQNEQLKMSLEELSRAQSFYEEAEGVRNATYTGTPEEQDYDMNVALNQTMMKYYPMKAREEQRGRMDTVRSLHSLFDEFDASKLPEEKQKEYSTALKRAISGSEVGYQQLYNFMKRTQPMGRGYTTRGDKEDVSHDYLSDLRAKMMNDPEVPQDVKDLLKANPEGQNWTVEEQQALIGYDPDAQKHFGHISSKPDRLYTSGDASQIANRDVRTDKTKIEIVESKLAQAGITKDYSKTIRLGFVDPKTKRMVEKFTRNRIDQLMEWGTIPKDSFVGNEFEEMITGKNWEAELRRILENVKPEKREEVHSIIMAYRSSLIGDVDTYLLESAKLSEGFREYIYGKVAKELGTSDNSTKQSSTSNKSTTNSGKPSFNTLLTDSTNAR